FALAQAAAAAAGVANAGTAANLAPNETAWAQRAGADLKKAGKNGVMVAGPAAAPVVHAIAHAVNQQIGAVGTTVQLLEDPAGDRPTHLEAITALAKAITSKQVEVLLILGGNPAYDAPMDLHFYDGGDKDPSILKSVPVTIHLSVYDDETSRACKWHLPNAHYLEAWGDARAWDGSANICQPLIEPLFGGKTAVEVLAIAAGEKETAAEAIVRRTWQEQLIKGGDFEKQWRKTLEAGVLENSAFPAATGATLTATTFAAPAPVSGPFVRFTPDSHAYDGRYANNGWLQETHDPITKLVWDNAAIISKKDADAWGVKQGDVIQLDAAGRSIQIAAFVQPGQPIGVITLPLGYGRTAAGNVGNRLGFNTYHFRQSVDGDVVSGVKVSKVGAHYTLATTMEHHILDEFAQKNALDQRVGGKGKTGYIVREATLAQYKADPRTPHATSHGGVSLQLFNNPSTFNTPNAWGMAVDLNTCTGCNACVVACQAENNIPVVGKDQVMYHREMQWLRIDRYFKGTAPAGGTAADDPNPQVVHQPMMCQQCETAPCEQVCPVAATVHDTEGLNTMVYNRCIGTRYCSNNCPYKVRRFNYFDWHAKDPRISRPAPYHGFPDAQQNDPAQIDPIRRLVYNPDVSVRMRGVMEKCTYCTQRLAQAKISRRNAAFAANGSEKGSEVVPDGEVMTACAQACATRAITFGNLNDKGGELVKLHKNPRAYEVLAELNTKPRTRYLAKLRNPAEGEKA
ncbi:MAG: 4Fe-4S dicluster domain-containing protein, partial [Phycisphaerae bacterium]